MSFSERVHFLAVEGVIGSGKTTLAKILAERYSATLLLEEVEENPYLARFYQDQRSHAFQTQMWFLLSRYRQLGSRFLQRDLFAELTVCDYTLDKDGIFAELTLGEDDLAMYRTVSDALQHQNPPKPDFVVYLQSSVDSLLQRIRKRGRPIERDIDPDYLAALVELYNQYFFNKTDCPVLIVNTDRIDFVKRSADLEDLITAIEHCPKGRHFYSPVSLS